MRRRQLAAALLLALTLALLAPTGAQRNATNAIAADVAILASMDGRGPDSSGLASAADWLDGQLRELGMEHVIEHATRQAFEVVIATSTGRASSLRLDGRLLTPGAEYVPLSFSDDVSFDGELVWLGEGREEDFARWELTGKVALVAPPDATDDPLDDEARAACALAAGAKALLLIAPSGELQAGTPQPALRGLGVARLRASAAARLRAGAPGPLALRASGQLEVTRQHAVMHNLIAALPDAQAPDAAPILLSAHYDGLGAGYTRTSRAQAKQVHPGADDNASGVAVMLEVARALRAHPARRPVWLVFTSGEELGALGARRVAHEVVGRWPEALVINADMLGRLRDDTLYVSGTPAPAQLSEAMAREAQAQGLRLSARPLRESLSDHIAYADVGLSTLHLTTGLHGDYHTPDDVAARVDAAGAARVAAWIVAVIRAQ